MSIPADPRACRCPFSTVRAVTKNSTWTVFANPAASAERLRAAETPNEIPMAKGIKRNVKLALAEANREIRGHASSGGHIAGALSGEGYSGGYAQALSDVLLLLNGVRPQTRHYWHNAKVSE